MSHIALDRPMPRPIRTAAEAAAGAPFASTRLLWTGGVWRCTLGRDSHAGPAGATVVVKSGVGSWRGDQDVVLRHHRREWAALVHAAPRAPGVTPEVLGADHETGVLVLADLGSGPTLLDLLRGTDPVAAADGLVGYGRSLGTLQAACAGQPFDAGGDPKAHHPSVLAEIEVEGCWSATVASAKAIGVLAPGRAATAEWDDALRLLDADRDLFTLCPGDPTHHNVHVGGGHAVLLDFESAGHRHAFLEAAALKFPFPHATPWALVPSAVLDAAEGAYRDALGVHDRAEHMAAAVAQWTVLRTSRLARCDEEGQDPDQQLRRRVQLIATIETLARECDRADALPALGAWSRSLAEELRQRWPEGRDEGPVYTAFARPGQRTEPPLVTL